MLSGHNIRLFTAMKKSITWHPRWTIIIVEFITLFVFWLVLSDHYNLRYILLGLFCSGLVTFLTYDTLFYIKHKLPDKGITSKMILISLLRVLIYIPWLLWEIVKANVEVAFLILHPKLPVKPVLLSFKTDYRLNITRVTLANSITLTPGTITVDLQENNYIVHAITPESADAIESARLLNKAGAIFNEKYQNAPEITWQYSLKDEMD
jgi:multicomponent Na+:H+ antiporter subunit E